QSNVASSSISLISFSTVSFHLVLGLPSGRFLFIFRIRTFCNKSPSSLHTCPNHSRRLHLIYVSIFGFSYRLYSSSLCLFSYIPRLPLYTGPYIFLSIFLSHIASFLLLSFVVDQVSHP
ncbi:Uncharacterized protein FWK35_00028135, partial [Aphis craccivora]